MPTHSVKGHHRQTKRGQVWVKPHSRHNKGAKSRVPHRAVSITPQQATRIRRLKDHLRNANRGEHIEGRDIALFSQNDSGFYESRYTPTLKNFARKNKRGVLDKDLARLGMSNHVPDLIERYNRSNDMVGHRWSPETKAVVADELVDLDWDDVKAGHWD